MTIQVHEKMANVNSWTCKQVADWLKKNGFGQYKKLLCDQHKIDGRVLLTLSESDLRQPPLELSVLGDIRRLLLCIKDLKGETLTRTSQVSSNGNAKFYKSEKLNKKSLQRLESSEQDILSEDEEEEYYKKSGIQSKILDPEIWKTVLSFLYVFTVFLITAFVMVVVHDRVPDMEKYPPLPDIFLDNVPYIPWAFQACEIIGMFLGTLWCVILVFHKHRRMFSLTGTVFLLRCVTMLITSLSVPGVHLQCEGKMYGDIYAKLRRTFEIWIGFGMTIQGVRSCDTPRKHAYYLHTVTWVANIFGLFLILAAHEHYSIDVFVAFYITSRLFLYYHTLANNRSLMLRDKTRTRIWFPLLTFFESRCDGIVPNEFEWPFPRLEDIKKKKKVNKMSTFVRGQMLRKKNIKEIEFWRKTSSSNSCSSLSEQPTTFPRI
ncbi:hypothetical protein KUTeg_004175 [Tegillarca granosa]|uniref:SAM domain-containing protein n=1 Tax=Tegillarca granosa TaxID=220873 RepID=A0ABQ9FP74_TEGGR|nr:hypothetical protein KUTeg_004175 [Tegillarca granosa]